MNHCLLHGSAGIESREDRQDSARRASRISGRTGTIGGMRYAVSDPLLTAAAANRRARDPAVPEADSVLTAITRGDDAERGALSITMTPRCLAARHAQPELARESSFAAACRRWGAPSGDCSSHSGSWTRGEHDRATGRRAPAAGGSPLGGRRGAGGTAGPSSGTMNQARLCAVGGDSLSFAAIRFALCKSPAGV